MCRSSTPARKMPHMACQVRPWPRADFIRVYGMQPRRYCSCIGWPAVSMPERRWRREEEIITNRTKEIPACDVPYYVDDAHTRRHLRVPCMASCSDDKHTHDQC